ncbi:U11/U12 small nuclear ribonucleoprotein 35 kDa protein isoform X1 [Neodiprion lecontei]|uniref:U11/U12 small nuclear ribonucleoprotein 35 kDa protein isoform X1 n=1 Tax=Neodiprion lecontei TaxID=441921 RepID=A0ABM3GHX3_NEOLC|nr:U11/U12 small nuclear ribonucleoprotein 35 kDa protein-like isoform X1 [Neodiprion pinetum]XP_046599866.1 U11/U12 small nuclear ribonucleoprotein 35 kDa protein isoform X1 [Neodiprion lecontei]
MTELIDISKSQLTSSLTYSLCTDSISSFYTDTTLAATNVGASSLGRVDTLSGPPEPACPPKTAQKFTQEYQSSCSSVNDLCQDLTNGDLILTRMCQKHWSPYARKYDPLKAGSIDGTDTVPHDKAVSRAIEAHYEPPRNLKSKPERTLFVGRLGSKITKHDLKECFSRQGDVLSVKLIVDVVTGLPQGYAFVEMKNVEQAHRAVSRLHDVSLNGCRIFVDFECGRTMSGWKPRRLGGGFGGKKESGQLRFGGRDRPFKKPILPVYNQ